MKKILFVAAMLVSLAVNAQVTKVSMQASGLTCSMCSNAINKSVKSLNFVDNVSANIKTSTFDITFKSDAKIDFEELKKRVEDAGFFVSKFVATFRFNNVQLKENEPINIGDKTLRFINVKDQALNGDKAVRILNKGFVSSKEYKKNAVIAPVKGSHIYNVTI
jgi:copper chaperone CopZ